MKTAVAEGVLVGYAGGDGSWTWTVSSALTDGTHTLKVRAADGAGNVSRLGPPYVYRGSDSPSYYAAQSPGTYQLRYNSQDSSGNAAVE